MKQGPAAAAQLVQKSHQRVRISIPMIPTCSTGRTQVNSPKNDRSQRRRGQEPVAHVERGHVPEHDDRGDPRQEHHRHSELIRYSDWNCSHVQKPTPNSVPALNVSQYQRGKRGPPQQAHPHADHDRVGHEPQHRVREPEHRRLLALHDVPAGHDRVEAAARREVRVLQQLELVDRDDPRREQPRRTRDHQKQRETQGTPGTAGERPLRRRWRRRCRLPWSSCSSRRSVA